ncbi:hypothetical protein NW754_001398 [Fusarium falciforme]|nr:hypothetical protein NW754_001398 [Fusarium falciforme]
MGSGADKLQGKKVVIVGGSSGVGFGVAEVLLEAGAAVTVVSSSPDKVKSAVQRLNSPNADGKVADVRDEEALTDVLRSLAPVDHIVFSGVDDIIRGKLSDTDLDEAKHLFSVKFWGAVVIGKAVQKYDIVRPRGSITITSGLAAVKPAKNASIGAALNAGVSAFTKGLAADLAEKGVRVNCVIPGLVYTELWDKTWADKEKQATILENAAKTLPVGFAGKPADVAEAYLYAIRADYATGTLITIDGGSLLN